MISEFVRELLTSLVSAVIGVAQRFWFRSSPVLASRRAGPTGRWGWRREESGKHPETIAELAGWLRGWADPYPAALYPGKLILTRTGPHRFEATMGRVREVQLPAGGIRVLSTRSVGPGDFISSFARSHATHSTVLVCEDGAGVRFDLAVPPGFTPRTVTAISEVTPGTTGPPAPLLIREVHGVRRYLSRTGAVCLLLGTLWTLLLLPSTSDLAILAYVFAFLLIFSGLMSVVRRWTMRLRERPPTDRYALSAAVRPVSSGDPVLEGLAADPDRAADVQVASPRFAPRPATELGRRWWAQRVPRRTAVRLLWIGLFPLLFVAIGLMTGIPAAQIEDDLAGPSRDAVAVVISDGSDRTLPGLPYDQRVSFVTGTRAVETDVVAARRFAVGDRVAVQYAVADPTAARLTGDADGIRRARLAMFGYGGLGTAGFLLCVAIGVRRARRLGRAAADAPVTVPFALVGAGDGGHAAVVRTPDGRLLRQPLAHRRTPRTAPGGFAQVRGLRSGTGLLVVQIGDDVFWPTLTGFSNFP